MGIQQSQHAGSQAHSTTHSSRNPRPQGARFLVCRPQSRLPSKVRSRQCPLRSRLSQCGHRWCWCWQARSDCPYDGDFSKVDFTPGELLGCVSGELGLRKFLEDRGHTLVVTDDKDGEDSVFEREIVDADIVISQPFWPAYITESRMQKAKNLKMCVTAGIGSDHVDLQGAIDRGLTVTEVTYRNSISVSEHVVMQMLALVRNYIPAYTQIVDGGWNIADCVSRSYDLEGMHIGTIAAA